MDGSTRTVTQDGLRFDRLATFAGSTPAELTPFPSRSGQQLGVRHYGPASTWGVVILHGSGYHGSYLAGLAQAVANSIGVRVFTPDLRGHGPSPERRGDIDYVDQLEDDLADLIAWMKQEHGIQHIILGGHSSGGGLAVRFAGGRYAASVAGYFALAPFLGHNAPTTRQNAGGWAQPRVGRIIALSALARLGIRALQGSTVITFDMPEAVRDGSETLHYSYRLNTGLAPRDYTRDLASVARPWLGLIGEEDEAFFPDALAITLQSHAEAEVQVLPGVGHLDLPSQPETAALLCQWIDKIRDAHA